MTTRHHSAGLILTFIVAAAGCKSEAPQTTVTTTAPLKPAAPPSSESRQGLQTPTVHVYMAEQYTQADRMKHSLIRGDLPAYRESASWIAEHELSATAPEPWRERARALQDAAKSARDAPTLAAAATGLGGVGEACGACHTALGKPSLAIAEPPTEGSGAQLHMARHQWAADRLWEGLIVPSDQIWIEGAEMMADAPLETPVMAPGTSVDPKLSALASSVHQQANAARGLPPAERASAYADFVQSCSACHEALKIELR